jgi:Na+/proline symporter
MHALDWLAIAAYLIAIIGFGVWFAGRASHSAESYLVADRKLPWWVIALSDVASAAGSDAVWVLIIFSGAFMGLHRFYWIGVVFAMPLAILWARYWRRLRLVSPGQIFEERYGGRAAGVFRGFQAVWGALVVSAVVLGYVLQIFAQTLAPFLDWEPDTVLIVFAGASMFYTMTSGLLGVAWSDVPQFCLLMLGRLLLAGVVVGLVGGMGSLLDQVELLRGANFLQPLPPSSPEDAEVFGKWAVDGGSGVALAFAGLLGIAGTQSASVQRSLAARSETDAALGQMAAAVLTLVVRVAPLIVIGLCAVVLFAGTEVPAVDVWAELVKAHAGPGLLGLILVGILAGSMSTIDTFLNFMTAGLFNDFYRRHLRPDASTKEQVWFCRLATVGVMGAAVLWAKVLFDVIDADWLNFVNSVLGLFILPLAMLRWTWWRLNIWGEISSFVLGLPLAWVLWFPLGFKDEPYWQAFLVLVLAGLGTTVVVTLLTAPEDEAVLRRFYERVRPPGFWGPVAGSISDAEKRERRADMGLAGMSLVFCGASVTALAAGFSRDPLLCLGALAALVGSGAAIVLAHRRGEAARRDLG